ncbi:hypothetical protein RhiJN_00505 [Ceratobasidium sp. AG-Ba]|nr:hypothetical protein RhiJN_00505 [Ceratobasidium sp. AG-Ba]QRW01536.1 hypothetical protein RhiLY_00533 [Ceratobasidium sp. AG-Ba]
MPEAPRARTPIHPTEHRLSVSGSSPSTERPRGSPMITRPASPPVISVNHGAECEQLLFKVIASIQGMKIDQERMASDNNHLYDEIDELRSIVEQQQAQIEIQKAEIERLSHAQLPSNESFAVCLIDGDGCIFDKKFLTSGYDGGRDAASTLTKQIHQDIGNTSTNLWTCVYYNHQGLKKALAKSRIVTELAFEEFCDGFRSASQLIHLMDVGRRKEAADEKIKEMLRLFVATPQTKVIYFGGGHDSGYGSTLSHYQNLGFEDKIVILKGYAEVAYDLRNLLFKVISSDGLFMQEKIDVEALGNINTSPTPTADGHSRNNSTESAAYCAPPAGLGTSYASAASVLVVPVNKSSNRSPSPGNTRWPTRSQRRIDVSKPLHKQNPSICNYYVLSSRGCRNGVRRPLDGKVDLLDIFVTVRLSPRT